MGCTELKERKPDSKESEGFVRLLLMSQGLHLLQERNVH